MPSIPSNSSRRSAGAFAEWKLLSATSKRHLVSAKRLNALMSLSTLVILSGCVLAAASLLYAHDAERVFQFPARTLAVALLLAVIVEGRAGLRNLLRVDIFMLGVLYLLTFLEFVFQLPNVTARVSMEGAQTAVLATLSGFAGIVIGRHAYPVKLPLARVVRFQVTPNSTMLLFLGSAFFGYLYMLLAVNFDIAELLHQAGRPRFAQPWSRSRLGGWNSLLNEVGLLQYLLPPLGASILMQWRNYNFLFLIFTVSVLLFVFYAGFAGGTRFVFLTHLITFTAVVLMLSKKLTLSHLAAVIAPVSFIAWFAIYYLPEIRTVGLQNFELETARTSTFFVDYNLVNVANLTQVFPRIVPYLGWEVPYTMAIRPIPRAVWPGKPDGLSFSIEEALGAKGYTLSASFVGEFWMAGGYFAVIVAALAFGAIAARWNQLGASAYSATRLIVFASGFVPAGIGMRSFMSVGPMLLPVLALLMFLRWRKK